MCSTEKQELVPIAELEQEICELAAHLAAGTCRWLVLLAEFDEREGWAQWGVKSCAHWLSWRCSIAPGTAREHVRVARRLNDLPLIRAAFGRGELSYCKARALTRVATPETEASLVEVALQATGEQLERLVHGYRRALDATDERARTVYEQRSLSWYWDDDGSLRLQGVLPAEQGRLLLNALTAFDQPGNPEEAGAVAASVAQTRAADALAVVAEMAIAARRNDQGAGRQGATSAPSCELVLHVDARSLEGEQPAERIELEDGPVVAPEIARRLGCDAAVVRMVERDGVPLSVGRRTRKVPPALRRALRSRDGGCRWPGCDHRRFLHAHHIHHWARGGRTSLDNLIQLCSHHHRLVHEGGFGIEHAGGEICFLRPDGRRFLARSPVCRARGDDLRHRQRAQGLAPGPEACRARAAGQPLQLTYAVDVLIAGAQSRDRAP